MNASTLCCSILGVLTFAHFKSQVKPAEPVYYVKSNVGKYSPFDIVLFYNDTLCVAIQGTGIKIKRDSIYIYPENGFKIMVGRMRIKNRSGCLSYSVIKRSMTIVGEKLPAIQQTISIENTHAGFVKIGDVKFDKLSNSKISYLLKKYLQNRNYRGVTGSFLFDCDSK